MLKNKSAENVMGSNFKLILTVDRATSFSDSIVLPQGRVSKSL